MKPNPVLMCAVVVWFTATIAHVLAKEPLVFHHVHLSAPDREAAANWYIKYLDGKPGVTTERSHNAMFGRVQISVQQGDAGLKGSSGSTVDHIGFSFADLEAKMKLFAAAGIKVLQPIREVRGKFKYAFIEDPWGTKIEVLEDADLLGFHHVHLFATDPHAMARWYAETMGGEVTAFKDTPQLPAIRYGQMWLIVGTSEAEREPTQGRVLDHIGWFIPSLDENAKAMKAQGIKFTTEPRDFNRARLAFIEGPSGVRIELVQSQSGQRTQ